MDLDSMQPPSLTQIVNFLKHTHIIDDKDIVSIASPLNAANSLDISYTKKEVIKLIKLIGYFISRSPIYHAFNQRRVFRDLLVQLGSLVKKKKTSDSKPSANDVDCESVDKMTVTQLKEFLTNRDVELPAASKRKAHYVQMAHDACTPKVDPIKLKTAKKKVHFSKKNTELKIGDGKQTNDIKNKKDNKHHHTSLKKTTKVTAHGEKRPKRIVKPPAKPFTIDDFEDDDDDEEDDDYEPSDE